MAKVEPSQNAHAVARRVVEPQIADAASRSSNVPGQLLFLGIGQPIDQLSQMPGERSPPRLSTQVR